MKKIIFTVAIMIGFATISSAQEAKKNTMQVSSSDKSYSQDDTNRVNSKLELSELSSIVDLKTVDTNSLYQILEMKNEVINNPQSSVERKTEVFKVFDAKLQGILGEKNYEILRSKPEVYKKMVSGTPQKK